MLLAEPIELVDLHDGESMTLSVGGFLDGSIVIHPKNPTPRHVRQHMDQRALDAAPPPGTPISVEVPAVRLLAQRLDKVSPAPYFDVTSKTLRADLLARLTNNPNLPLVIKLTAHGKAPQKRYSVEVS